MSESQKKDNCPDCYLPPAICICHPAVYDPVARREEILGKLGNLDKLIEDALKTGAISPVNPFSEGHGDSSPSATALDVDDPSVTHVTFNP